MEFKFVLLCCILAVANASNIGLGLTSYVSPSSVNYGSPISTSYYSTPAVSSLPSQNLVYGTRAVPYSASIAQQYGVAAPPVSYAIPARVQTSPALAYASSSQVIQNGVNTYPASQAGQLVASVPVGSPAVSSSYRQDIRQSAPIDYAAAAATTNTVAVNSNYGLLTPASVPTSHASTNSVSSTIGRTLAGLSGFSHGPTALTYSTGNFGDNVQVVH